MLLVIFQNLLLLIVIKVSNRQIKEIYRHYLLLDRRILLLSKYILINLLSSITRLFANPSCATLTPNQVIIAWVLNNLISPYEGFIIIVTQSYKENSSNINLELLFSNLIDKARCLDSKNKEIALFNKEKNPSFNKYKAKGNRI